MACTFPQQGTITAFGQCLTEEALERPPFGPQFRKEVGFLFQHSDAQLFCATVEEELAFAPLQLRWPKAEIRQRIDDTLRLLEIAHLRERTPQNLSGGEKKRVALASLTDRQSVRLAARRANGRSRPAQPVDATGNPGGAA